MLKTVPKPTLPKFHDLPTLFAPEWGSKALKGRLQEVNNAGEAATRARTAYVTAFEAHAKGWDNPATADASTLANLPYLRVQQLQAELHCRELADAFVLACDEEGKTEELRRYQSLADARRKAAAVLVQAGFACFDLQADPLREKDLVLDEYQGTKDAHAAIKALANDRWKLQSACNTHSQWTGEVREALLSHRTKVFAAAAAG
ncbi:hypothetical protein [Planctomyces sp. SH-PL14]|uniref:hypothetical protein n=1 Tax=Planctomyces sp. SH-PL14 TaxID=1632864 RepID=UPI00078CFB0A|nr:hypothetical protein [Planctomyces sp. SH-PL14]AMV18205.1 hypothetical protein VT03_09975 [Planctomyces sp. SH-PL14]